MRMIMLNLWHRYKSKISADSQAVVVLASPFTHHEPSAPLIDNVIIKFPSNIIPVQIHRE